MLTHLGHLAAPEHLRIEIVGDRARRGDDQTGECGEDGDEGDCGHKGEKQ